MSFWTIVGIAAFWLAVILFVGALCGANGKDKGE